MRTLLERQVLRISRLGEATRVMLSLLSELEHDRWPGQEPSTTSIRPPRLFSFVLMPSQQSEIDQMKAKLKALDR